MAQRLPGPSGRERDRPVGGGTTGLQDYNPLRGVVVPSGAIVHVRRSLEHDDPTLAQLDFLRAPSAPADLPAGSSVDEEGHPCPRGHPEVEADEHRWWRWSRRAMGERRGAGGTPGLENDLPNERHPPAGRGEVGDLPASSKRNGALAAILARPDELPGRPPSLDPGDPRPPQDRPSFELGVRTDASNHGRRCRRHRDEDERRRQDRLRPRLARAHLAPEHGRKVVPSRPSCRRPRPG